jgi:hypothetical protein
MTGNALRGVLAVGTTGTKGANGFLNSQIGHAFEAVCGAVGVVIVVACVIRMVNSVTKGRPGEGVRMLVYGLLIGGMLVDLSLTVKGVQATSKLVGDAVSSIGSITG